MLRFRPSLAAAVALVLATAASARSGQPASSVPQYLIAVKQIEMGPDGQERVLSSPQLLTIEDQPAELHVGCHVPAPKESGLNEPLEAGLKARFRLFRNDGRLFIDADFRRAAVQAETGQGVRIATVGMRVIESLTLGRKIEVPLAGMTASGRPVSRFELMVTEATGKQPPVPASDAR